MTLDTVQDSLAVKLATIAIDSFCSPSWEKVAIGVGVAAWLVMALWQMARTGAWGVKLAGKVVAWPFRATPIDPDSPAAAVLLALDGEVAKDGNELYCLGICRISNHLDLAKMMVHVDGDSVHLLPHERETIHARASERSREIKNSEDAAATKRRRAADARVVEERALARQLAAEELRRRLTAPPAPSTPPQSMDLRSQVVHCGNASDPLPTAELARRDRAKANGAK